MPSKTLKILVPPGTGDIHWVMVKMQSFLRKHDAEGELWIMDEGLPRSLEYVKRLPFVKAGGYYREPISLDDPTFASAYYHGERDVIEGFRGFDYFMCFNGSLTNGKDLATEVLPDCEPNWDYPITETPEDSSFGDAFAKAQGPYILLFVTNNRHLGEWLDACGMTRFMGLISSIQASYPQHKLVLTGAEWDRPYPEQLAPLCVDMVGKTSMGQALSLIRRASAFVGYPAGNTILSTHFGTPTLILWSAFYRNRTFRTNWASPAALRRSYATVEVETLETRDALEKLHALVGPGLRPRLAADAVPAETRKALPFVDAGWTGRRCFVIGGGPSADAIDFSALKDELTIGVNMSFLKNTTINLVRDLRLMEELQFDPQWKEYKGTKIWMNSEVPAERGRYHGVVELRESMHLSRGAWSRSLEHGLFRGHSSGATALNLADVLGADPIYLIGFDSKPAGANTVNWHKEYPASWATTDEKYRGFVKDFEDNKPNICGRVFNLNAESGLRCFPFMHPDDVLGNGTPPDHAPPWRARAKEGKSCWVGGFEGLGDTFYMRPAIKRLAEREGVIYLSNPWPQLFWDMPEVRPVRPQNVALRTQRANVQSVLPEVWNDHPPNLKQYHYAYYYNTLREGKTPLDAFMAAFSVQGTVDFSMRANPGWTAPWMFSLPRPLGVVHQPTIRREWENKSRNPAPEHIQAIIDAHPEVCWVAIGWEEPNEEWPDGAPLHGIRYEARKGQLPITEVLALLARADIALCGPSFVLPAAAAVGTPVFTVFGGSIPPHCLVDPRMGARVAYAAPEPFCACFENNHGCRKDIRRDDLLNAFNSFAAPHLAVPEAV